MASGEGAGISDSAKRARLQLFILGSGAVLIAAIILARSPLRASFWLDEAISWWVVSGTFGDAVERAIRFKQSVAYHAVLWGYARLFGSSELAFRLLSVASFAAGLFFLFRIGSLLTNRRVGLLAVILLLGADGALAAALSARPYSLALAFVLAAMFCAFKVERGGKGAWSAGAVAGFALATAFHPFFALAIVVPIVSLLFQRQTLSKSTKRRAWSTCGFALLVSCIAGGVITSSMADGPQLSFAAMPSLTSLVTAIVPATLLVYVLFPAIIGFIQEGASLATIITFSRSREAALTVWWLFGPLFFFSLSWLAGQSFWVPRYWLWSLPGLAIVGALVLSSFFGRARWWIVAAAFLGLVLFRESVRVWTPEPWREAAEKIQAPFAHVVLVSGLIEAKNSAFVRDPANHAYLSAPILMYAPNAMVTPAVEGSSEDRHEFFAAIADQLRTKRGPVYLVGVRESVRKEPNPVFEDYAKRLIEQFGALHASFELEHLAVREFRSATAAP